jgi:hypothetical protein
MQPLNDTWRSVKFCESRGTVVGKVTEVGTGQQKGRGSIPDRHKRFCILKITQTGSCSVTMGMEHFPRE